MGDDRAIGLAAPDPAGDVGEVRDQVARDVRDDGLAERLHQADRVAQETAALDRVADPGEDLLLSGGAGEVALAGCLSDAGEGQRLLTVQVVAAARIAKPREKPYSS